MTLVGRYFQIRNDYQNLCSPDYVSQKCFYEDLDEGKFSLALIQMLNHTEKMLMQALLLEQKQRGKMTAKAKKKVLGQFDKYGSWEYAKGTAQSLEVKAVEEIGRIEELTGGKNWILRLLVEA
jgi:geranylgeranyl pyrophosphate synthase